MRMTCCCKTDDKIETLMNNFEKMMRKIWKVELVKHLEYAVILHFLDRLEKSENELW